MSAPNVKLLNKEKHFMQDVEYIIVSMPYSNAFTKRDYWKRGSFVHFL